MRRRLAPIAAVVAVVASVHMAAAGAAPAHRPSHVSHAMCDTPDAPFAARCLGRVQWSRTAPITTSIPHGLAPALLKDAYGYSTDPTAGAGRTIAIVDAFDDPRVERDLATFSKQYGLPPCTTRNRCLSVVNQRGRGALPSANSEWALEISLDVQWAHAIAPGARILLVEADSNFVNDLYIAEDYARTHAVDVSNSWGLNEFDGEQADDAHFTQKGVSVFVAAGDGGATPQWPSTSPSVVSVGGTHLDFSNDAFTSETAWSRTLVSGVPAGGGGGCSAYEPAPAAQLPFSTVLCGDRRATPDVSLDADPASGVSVYYSGAYHGQTGWFIVGGTSAATPMVAARAATTGIVVNAGTVYGNALTFRDIVDGDNGQACGPGYDLCSGRGSWIGATP